MAEILFIPSVLADYILDVKSSGMLFLHANLALIPRCIQKTWKAKESSFWHL